LDEEHPSNGVKIGWPCKFAPNAVVVSARGSEMKGLLLIGPGGGDILNSLSPYIVQIFINNWLLIGRP
jgi:hypothetical protein